MLTNIFSYSRSGVWGHRLLFPLVAAPYQGCRSENWIVTAKKVNYFHLAISTQDRKIECPVLHFLYNL